MLLTDGRNDQSTASDGFMSWTVGSRLCRFRTLGTQGTTHVFTTATKETTVGHGLTTAG